MSPQVIQMLSLKQYKHYCVYEYVFQRRAENESAVSAPSFTVQDLTFSNKHAVHDFHISSNSKLELPIICQQPG